MLNAKLKITVAIFLLYTLHFTLYTVSCYAIEIPLTPVGGRANIGYVDMNKVFESYSKVEVAKKEYEEKRLEKDAELKKTEKEIKDIETEIVKLKLEIADLKQRISALNQQLPQERNVDTASVVEIQPATPTPSDRVSIETELSAKETELKGRTELLTKKRAEYEASMKETEKFLKEFEESKTLSIMAELYVIIGKLAKEENIGMIVERASILYGQPDTDLTNKVIDRLRGK